MALVLLSLGYQGAGSGAWVCRRRRMLRGTAACCAPHPRPKVRTQSCRLAGPGPVAGGMWEGHGEGGSWASISLSLSLSHTMYHH